MPNETFKAAAHFVVTGKRRRFPNVKIILAHMGGSLPFLAPRVAALSNYMGCALSPEEIIQDFSSFYYDTALAAHRTTLTAMQTFIESDHLLFGSDFPGAFHVFHDAMWFFDPCCSCQLSNGRLVYEKHCRVLCQGS